MKLFLAFVVAWLVIVLITSCARADNVQRAQDVYSVWLERTAYIHDVDSGRAEYNPEVDKGLGIMLDNACGEWTPKQCWYNMLYANGFEFIPFRGF